jgi:hypothetical protein
MGRMGAKPVQQEVLIQRRIKRFLDRIKKTSSCWIWTGAMTREGCPTVLSPWTDRPTTAARIIYRIYCGEPPEDCQVKVKCETPYCLNPQHLYLYNIDTKQNENIKSEIYSA